MTLFIDESEVERFDSAIDALEDSLNGSRDELSLHDIADLIDSYDIDKLRTVLATGDEEGRVLWQMLFSKDEDGDTIQNPTSIELIEEDAGVMFVRSERYFQDDHREPDGKWYAYGVVIGIDDTDERFFMHRLESDADLRNEDFDWTFGAIKEKMGFDLYYDELVEPSDIPFDNAILLQGDVALVRRDFRTVMWERFDDVYETRVQREAGEHIEEYLDAHPELADHDDIYTSTYRLDINVRLDDTDALKDLQDELNIEEDEVRAEQERRGISRLSAKRRGNIIEDTLHERALEWMEANTDFDRETIEMEAEESVRNEFEETQEQVNLILGNHSVFLGPASRNRTLEIEDPETLATVVVPERADGFVWHDEHDNKKIELPEGVYEFKFLQGHEDQWWQQG